MSVIGQTTRNEEKQNGFSKESIQYLIEPSRFETIAYQARLLEGQIEQSRVLSERVSRTVRQLDEAQMNVQQALALVEDVVNLKGCANGVLCALKEDDLVGATGYVRQFHDIASVAAKASDDYERMIASERDLQTKVMAMFETATAQGNSDDVARYCALLGPLGLTAEGVKGYLNFARQEIGKVIESQPEASHGDLSDIAGESLQRLFNGAAAFLDVHVAVCAAALSQSGGGPALLQLVHHDIEDAAVKVVRKYITDMELAKSCAAPPMHSTKTKQKSEFEVSIEQLNEKLDGIALIMQHTESYDRFVRHKARELEKMDQLQTQILPVQTKLNEALAELGGFFTLLEQNQLGISLAKALEMDDLPDSAQAAIKTGDLASLRGCTTSAVEDSMYVCQSSVMRAVASGHPQTAAAVFNHVTNLLESNLFDHLVSAAQTASSSLSKSSDISTLGQLTGAADNASSYLTTAARSVAKKATEGRGDKEQQLEEEKNNLKELTQRVGHLASLNNLENASLCISRLQDELVLEVAESFEDGPDIRHVLQCANELGGAASKYRDAGRGAIESLVASLRPALRTAVEESLPSDKAEYFSSDDQTEGEEWVSRFLDKVLMCVSPVVSGAVLSHANDGLLFTAAAEFVSKRLEAALRKLRFSLNGSLVLEKDIRGIIAFFAERAGRHIKSESFLRLRQFMTLLTVDALQDTEEMWAETQNWQLSADEAKKVLSLRVDFPRNLIDKLSLRNDK